MAPQAKFFTILAMRNTNFVKKDMFFLKENGVFTSQIG